MTKSKYKTGFVIGRFQPFHKGHEYLFKKSFEICDQLIIGIGSANKSNKNNPWVASKIRKMLQEFVKHEGFEMKVIKIVNLYDNSDDDIWFENLYKKTGKFDVALGNNPWNNGIIRRHGIPVKEIGFYKREILEGIQIRSLIRENKKWEDRVPKYLIKTLME